MGCSGYYVPFSIVRELFQKGRDCRRLNTEVPDTKITWCLILNLTDNTTDLILLHLIQWLSRYFGRLWQGLPAGRKWSGRDG
jgi:hypothetical protein